MKHYTAEDLLEAREKRAEEIGRLLKTHKTPIVAMRVNYPGLNKTNDVTLAIIREMRSILCEMFGKTMCFGSFQQGAEGPVFLAGVREEGRLIKKAVIDLEEKHTLGRFVDIDIYTHGDKSISRQELGYPRRKCYLCHEEAHYCVRSRRHSMHDVIKYIEDGFKSYKENKLLNAREWTD